MEANISTLKKRVEQRDWKLKPMPKKHALIPTERFFTAEEMKKIKLGFKPESMDDRYFIYFENDRLYLHRSWSGFCNYVAYFKHQQGKFVLYQLEANRNPKQYQAPNDDYDTGMMFWVIDFYLFGRETRMPTIETNLRPET